MRRQQRITGDWMKHFMALGIAAGLALGGAWSADAADDDRSYVEFCEDFDAALTAAIDLDECTAYMKAWVAEVNAPKDGAPSGGTGAWSVGAIEKDPLTDEAVTVARLRAKSGKSVFGDAFTLNIRCRGGKTELWINWHDYLGSGGWDGKKVELRIGSSTARKDGWNLSTDSVATHYDGDVERFIKTLFGNTSLVARTTPYSSSPSTAVFDITGIQNAVANVRQACDW